MNPFRRLWVVIKARFSRLVDRAENPHDLLDYSYEKQLEELNEFRQGLAGLVTAKKRVQSRKEKLEAQVMKLDKAAHDAVSLGKEDDARTFLERKQFLQDELDGVDREVVELQSQQEQMIRQEREVQAKVERFRTEKEVSKAQYSAAKARVSAGEAAAGISSASNEGGQAMMRAKEKVDQMKARAEALDELEQAGSFTDIATGESSIDRQIAEMTSTAGVEAELEKIKLEIKGTEGGQVAEDTADR
jgi:phage shock protein A